MQTMNDFQCFFGVQKHIVEELALAVLVWSGLWVNAYLHVVSEPLRGSLLSSPTTEWTFTMYSVSGVSLSKTTVVTVPSTSNCNRGTEEKWELTRIGHDCVYKENKINHFQVKSKLAFPDCFWTSRLLKNSSFGSAWNASSHTLSFFALSCC